MTNLILTILISSLISLGVHIITREGYLFGFVERFWDYIETKKEKVIYPTPIFSEFILFLSKPLTECPPCMGSFWGVVGFLSSVSLHFVPLSLTGLVVTCLATCALNFIIYFNLIGKNL